MNQSEFETKWYHKIVKPKGHYGIPNKEYYVTACLLEENGAKFAIMATDYSKENKDWISLDLGEDEIHKLEERFEIIGDYNNIDFEILFEFVAEENGDYIIAYENFTSKFGGVFRAKKVDFNDLNIGDKVFDIGWTSTTGEKLRKFFHLKRGDWIGLSNQEIYNNSGNVRDWIKGGLYHFGELDL